MQVVAASFEVDLRPESNLGFVVTLLIIVVVAYAFVAGASSVGATLAPKLSSAVTLLGIAVLLVLWSQARDDDTDRVRFTVETDRLAVDSGAGDPGSGSAADGQPFFTHQHDSDARPTHSHD